MKLAVSEFTKDQDGRTHAPAQRFTSTHGAEIFRDMITQRAFAIWQSRGCPSGTALQDWLQAEVEVKAEIAHKRKRR